MSEKGPINMPSIDDSKFFSDAEASLDKRHAHEREQMRAYEPLIYFARRLGLLWCEREEAFTYNGARSWMATWAVGFATHERVSLDLRLGKNDGVNGNGTLDEILIEVGKFPGMTKPKKDDSESWEAVTFLSKLESDDKARFMVRCFISQSNLCKRVGTGKFEEIMEIKCEEQAT